MLKSHRFWKTKIILITYCGLLLGCSSSKVGDTTVNRIKEELDTAINANINLRQKLPTEVSNALLPDLPAISTVNNSSLNIDKTKFDINATNVAAREFFLGLVEGTKYNVIIHPEVSGSISLTLKKVTVKDVINIAREVYGYGSSIEANNITITPAKLQTRTFKVNYLDMERSGNSKTHISSTRIDTESSEDTGSSEINTSSNANFWTQLETTLSAMLADNAESYVAVNPITGTIVVHALPGKIAAIEKFLHHSERFLNRQVVLETKILEVELNDGYRAGINWAQINKHFQATQLGGALHAGDISSTLPNASGVVGDSTPNISLNRVDDGKHVAPNLINSTPVFGGILTFGLNFHRLATLVELLSSQGNVQVLSSPRVSTTNNQKAIIKIGTDEFFVTNVTNTTTTEGAATTTTPSVEFDAFFSGIALDVTPQIDERNNVTLHIHPTISTVVNDLKTIPFTNNASVTYPLAKSTIRESDSIVRAKNGQYVVIGGLMQDKTSEVVTGVPILKSIPYIGTIFRQTRQQAKKTELVILVRPIVVDANTWNDRLNESYTKFDNLDVGFHVGGTSKIYGNEAELKGFRDDCDLE